MRQHLSRVKTQLNHAREDLAYRLSGPRRLLFDHLPKCAGSAIIDYLRPHYPKQHVFEMNGRNPPESVAKFQAMSQKERYRCHLVAGHFTHQLLDHVHPDTLTLTIFRDPVDRIISHYFFVKQDQMHYLHERVMRAGMSLMDYATSGISDELENWYVTHFTRLPQEEVRRNPEEALRLAGQVIADRYDLVGFQEDLPTIATRLQHAVGLEQPFANKRVNRTAERSSVEEVPEEVRAAIARVNALDVRLCASLQARQEVC